MIESVKILFLGVVLYLCPVSNHFFLLGGHWFFELREPDKHRDKVSKMRKTFWKSLLLVCFAVFVVLFFQYRVGFLPTGRRNWLRIVAAVFALTATLGRGGWSLQTWSGTTIIERIDRGMFVIGQIGATVLLLIALGL